MAKKKPGLGPMGLSSLLDKSSATKEADASNNEPHADGQLRDLPLEYLQPGQYQPRKQMDKEPLDELAQSIREQGVMQPILVRPIGKKRYEIIAGERRWRASQMAQKETIPAVVRDLNDQAAIALALIENLQREDLNPMEEAEALFRLQKEFELTQEEVAKAVGKSRVTVANMLRLMKLDDKVKTYLTSGQIEMGHARAVLSLDANQQCDLSSEIIAKKLNVRQTEARVKSLLNPEAKKPKDVAENADIKRLERVLGDRLGAQIDIKHSAKGNGKLVIGYGDLNELEGILKRIK